MSVTPGYVAAAERGLFDCSWKTQSSSAYYSSKLVVSYTKSIRLTWEPVRNTDKLHIQHSDDIILHEPEYKKEEIHIRLDDPSYSSSRKNNFDQVTCFTLPFLVLLHVVTGNRFIVSVAILGGMVFQTLSTDCNPLSVHIKIPVDYIEFVCKNQEKCFPTTCNLARVTNNDRYSKVNAQNSVLFSDAYCSIKKPEQWDEWIAHHYNLVEFKEELYYIDTDGDSLVNLLEYYADLNVSDKDGLKRTRKSLDVTMIGTDPHNPDSDGDLLLDGFEFANDLPPTQKGDSRTDTDGDGLTDLDEQIHRTNPLKPDSDGDGVRDGTEIQLGTDPNNPTDKGTRPISEKSASVKLTIGDPSGSHSERYTLNVGSISHQSPGFGIVGNGIYQFNPGTYTITVKWVGTKLSTPDFDYTAAVEKISQNDGVNVKIKDPSRLLGLHHESYYDYTLGKSATMIVTAICNEVDENDPTCFNNCESCQKNSFTWFKNKCLHNIKNVPKSSCKSFCEKCKAWYEEEVKDTKWLEELNREFPCPCKAITLVVGIDAAPCSSSIEWGFDKACLRNSYPLCGRFHSGAYGCMRSKSNSRQGAQQQCCYDSNLNWIRSGLSGAGTPDKEANFRPHQDADVDPWKWCCEECPKEDPKKKDYCDFYIKGVRKGGTTCTSKGIPKV